MIFKSLLSTVDELWILNTISVTNILSSLSSWVQKFFLPAVLLILSKINCLSVFSFSNIISKLELKVSLVISSVSSKISVSDSISLSLSDFSPTFRSRSTLSKWSISFLAIFDSFFDFCFFNVLCCFFACCFLFAIWSSTAFLFISRALAV